MVGTVPRPLVAHRVSATSVDGRCSQKADTLPTCIATADHVARIMPANWGTAFKVSRSHPRRVPGPDNVRFLWRAFDGVPRMLQLLRAGMGQSRWIPDVRA